MHRTLAACATLQRLQIADVWEIYTRVCGAGKLLAASRGGGALAALSQRVEASERAVQEAAEVRDGADACVELKALANAEIMEAREVGARDAALLLEKVVQSDGDIDESGTTGAVLEIRAGTGGAEAALFARDLLLMYERLAIRKRWRWKILSQSTSSAGGLRDAAVNVGGVDALNALMMEAGVHRVQRVPATESAGRLHTSTATVSVLRATKFEDTPMNEADVRLDVYRASGAGGQHVNTTESAVRVTHIPTGLVATSQDERSQHRNRALAMASLRLRLAAKLRKDEADKRVSERRLQMGSGSGGERSDRIRTYNWPQNRVTDHRVVLDDDVLRLMPSAKDVVGEKNAPLQNVVQGLQDLERLMGSVKHVDKLNSVVRLVRDAERSRMMHKE